MRTMATVLRGILIGFGLGFIGIGLLPFLLLRSLKMELEEKNRRENRQG